MGNVLTAFFAADYIAHLDGVTVIDGGWLNHHWMQLGYQLADSISGGVYSFVMTTLILFILNLTPGLHLRANEEAEILGIDDAEIGEFGKSSKPTFTRPTTVQKEMGILTIMHSLRLRRAHARSHQRRGHGPRSRRPSVRLPKRKQQEHSTHGCADVWRSTPRLKPVRFFTPKSMACRLSSSLCHSLHYTYLAIILQYPPNTYNLYFFYFVIQKG